MPLYNTLTEIRVTSSRIALLSQSRTGSFKKRPRDGVGGVNLLTNSRKIPFSRKIKDLHFRFQKGVSKELKTIAIASVGHTVLSLLENAAEHTLKNLYPLNERNASDQTRFATR